MQILDEELLGRKKERALESRGEAPGVPQSLGLSSCFTYVTVPQNTWHAPWPGKQSRRYVRLLPQEVELTPHEKQVHVFQTRQRSDRDVALVPPAEALSSTPGSIFKASRCVCQNKHSQWQGLISRMLVWKAFESISLVLKKKTFPGLFTNLFCQGNIFYS